MSVRDWVSPPMECVYVVCVCAGICTRVKIMCPPFMPSILPPGRQMPAFAALNYRVRLMVRIDRMVRMTGKDSQCSLIAY